jgi:hypothetical protein
MAKAETTLVAVRVPSDLVALIDASGEGRTGFIVQAVRARLDGAITAIFGDGERRPVGTGHEGGIVTAANAGAIILELQDRISELEEQLGDLAAAQSEIVALQDDVARLKRELATRPVMAPLERPVGAVTKKGVVPYVDADPSSEKVVAAILPVTGDQFPRQLTWQQKRDLAENKKGKRT